MDLKAKTGFKYRGKPLLPGERFTAGRSHGRLLVAIGRAEVDGGVYDAPRPRTRTKRADPLDHDRDGKAGGSEKPGPSAELQAAREEYTRVLGKRFFSGWGVDELRARIAQHQADAAGDTSPELTSGPHDDEGTDE